MNKVGLALSLVMASSISTSMARVPMTYNTTASQVPVPVSIPLPPLPDSKMDFLADIPETVKPKPQPQPKQVMQNEYMAYSPAESFPLPGQERPDYIEPTPAQLAIREIVNLDIDTKVKVDMIKIIQRNFKKQQRSNMSKEEMLSDILTNQRIIIGLMTVLVAKLVIYDLWIEKMEKANNER